MRMGVGGLRGYTETFIGFVVSFSCCAGSAMTSQQRAGLERLE